MGYAVGRRVMLAIVALSFVAIDARRSEASPVTWLYAGSVASSFDQSLVPNGTPATVALTVDPAINLALGVFDRPADGGSYYVTADIQFLGLDYTYFAAFEINWDLAHDVQLPGFIRVVPLSISGPPLDPAMPAPYYRVGPACCGQNYAYLYSDPADPLSPAFPSLPTADFTLHFLNLNGGDGTIRVTGINTQAVPEPATGMLVLTGALALIVRRKLRAG